MSLRDLLDAGIHIQGEVEIRLFDTDTDEILDQRRIDNERFYDLPETWLDKEIRYLFSIDILGLLVEIYNEEK